MAKKSYNVNVMPRLVRMLAMSACLSLAINSHVYKNPHYTYQTDLSFRSIMENENLVSFPFISACVNVGERDVSVWMKQIREEPTGAQTLLWVGTSTERWEYFNIL